MLILLFMYFINAVSHSSDGINIISFQFLSKILNVRIYNSVLTEIIRAPHSIQKLVSCKHTPLVFQKFPQKFKFLLGKLQLLWPFPCLVACQIQAQIALAPKIFCIFFF